MFGSTLAALVLTASAAVGAAAPDPTPASTLRDMTLPQKVGQLFMVGTPADEVDRVTRSQIGRFHVGNLMLTGRSYGGVAAPARVSRTMQREVSDRATAGVRLFVATDQEGGLVRVLQGRGFSDIPTALEQGRWSTRTLRRSSICAPHHGQFVSWAGLPEPLDWPRWIASSAWSVVLGVAARPTHRPRRKGSRPHVASSPSRINSHAQISAAARWNCCRVRRRRV